MYVQSLSQPPPVWEGTLVTQEARHGLRDCLDSKPFADLLALPPSASAADSLHHIGRREPNQCPFRVHWGIHGKLSLPYKHFTCNIRLLINPTVPRETCGEHAIQAFVNRCSRARPVLCSG